MDTGKKDFQNKKYFLQNLVRPRQQDKNEQLLQYISKLSIW